MNPAARRRWTFVALQTPALAAVATGLGTPLTWASVIAHAP
jgi:hypothetical protein